MNQKAFEGHVRRALDSLPPQIARALENVAVVVEEVDPADPDLFGLWEYRTRRPRLRSGLGGPQAGRSIASES